MTLNVTQPTNFAGMHVLNFRRAYLGAAPTLNWAATFCSCLRFLFENLSFKAFKTPIFCSFHSRRESAHTPAKRKLHSNRHNHCKSGITTWRYVETKALHGKAQSGCDYTLPRQRGTPHTASVSSAPDATEAAT